MEFKVRCKARKIFPNVSPISLYILNFCDLSFGDYSPNDLRLFCPWDFNLIFFGGICAFIFFSCFRKLQSHAQIAAKDIKKSLKPYYQDDVEFDLGVPTLA
jgi:hypothetical protein